MAISWKDCEEKVECRGYRRYISSADYQPFHIRSKPYSDVIYWNFPKEENLNRMWVDRDMLMNAIKNGGSNEEDNKDHEYDLERMRNKSTILRIWAFFRHVESRSNENIFKSVYDSLKEIEYYVDNIKEDKNMMAADKQEKLEILEYFERWAWDQAMEETVKLKEIIIRSSSSCQNSAEKEKRKKQIYAFRKMVEILNKIKTEDIMRIQTQDEINKLVKKDICFPQPVNMWDDGCCTTVEWEDGTKTTVRAEHPDRVTDFGGFTAALAKKLYGSTTKVTQAYQKALENPKKKAKEKKAAREAEKKLKQQVREEKAKLQELRIKAKMDEMYIESEAERRINMQNERRTHWTED